MPTLPQPEHTPHQHRQVAESFGTDAERYDRTRPRYPAALVERILAASPGRDLLDVGSGTGIVTRQFQAAGCQVLGVEPDARMAGLARRLGCPAEVATFEEWDPAGRSFDAVVAGQAWHWIDPVAGAAKAARVLRPGGLLAPFWNTFAFPSDLADQVADVCQRALPDSPFDFRPMARGALDGYRRTFAAFTDAIRGLGGFSEPEQWQCEWEWCYTRDAWLDQMPSQGAFTRLTTDKLAEVLEGVGSAIDALGGSFTMRYTTVSFIARRANTR